MLLVSININGTTHRISDETCELTHLWKNRIIKFSPPQFQMAKTYGGYCRMGFGAISISPDVFVDDWPPPVELTSFQVQYTDTTEAAATTLITGRAYLRAYTKEAVTYDVHPDEYAASLLAEDCNYDSRTVCLPRAFGTVTHVTPVRLFDVGGEPTYHKGGIPSVVIGTDWDVYDDGIGINANVSDNGDGTFSLTVDPTGAVTMSGVGQDGTIDTIMDWACGQYLQGTYPGLDLTYNNAKKRTASPAINYWADRQKLLIDFLSDLAAYGTHLFYILSGTLYLVDMKQSNGTYAVSRFFGAKYEYETPVSLVRSKWRTKAAVTEGIGSYVKSYDHESTRKTAYAYGKERSLTPYHDVAIYIKTAQMDVLTFLLQQQIEIEIPNEGALILPGQLISWTDTALRNDTSYEIYARSIRYNFDKASVVIIGEKKITASDLPIKAGMIFPYYQANDNIPAGWSKYADVKDRCIVGHGTDHSAATVGGSKTISFNCASDGGHVGAYSHVFALAAAGGSEPTWYVNAGADPTDHSHDLTVQFEPRWVNLCFIQANCDLEQLPAWAIVLTDSNIRPTGLQPFSLPELIMRGATDMVTAGGGSYADETQSAIADHSHGTRGGGATAGSEGALEFEAAGAHANHTLTLTITDKLKKVYLRAWTKNTAFDLVSGMIGFCDVFSIPADCVFCDGDNGTPDTQDSYIVLSANADNANSGTQEVGLSGTLSNLTHDHAGGVFGI
jgi:hypothetical protein